MPPQKDEQKVSKQQAQKIVKDHTFGIKNKNKSVQVQKEIKGMVNKVASKGISQEKILAEEFERKKQQKKEEEQQMLMASLFQTVDTMKSAVGDDDDDENLDPQLRICAYFKQGLCQKGKQCKFSHDLSTKSQEIDLYTDQRSQFSNKQQDENSQNWGADQIEQVSKANEGKYKNQKPTEIICKFYLDAIEKGVYGWNWMCPNGMTCHYRHCLPPGYVLKQFMPKEKDQEKVAIEQIIDDEISALGKSGVTRTPVTRERFLEWKERRRVRKEQEAEEKIKEEEKGKGSKLKAHLGLTGRALFHFDPSVFIDDDQAVDTKELEIREDYVQDEEEVNNYLGEGDNENEQGQEGEENNEVEETKQNFIEEPQVQEQENIQETPTEIKVQTAAPKAEENQEEQPELGQKEKQEVKEQDGAEQNEEQKKKQKKKKNKEGKQDELVVNDDVFL